MHNGNPCPSLFEAAKQVSKMLVDHWNAHNLYTLLEIDITQEIQNL